MYWADVPGLSARDSRCPAAWQQYWQQTAGAAREPNRISSSGRACPDRFRLDQHLWPVLPGRCCTPLNCSPDCNRARHWVSLPLSSSACDSGLRWVTARHGTGIRHSPSMPDGVLGLVALLAVGGDWAWVARMAPVRVVPDGGYLSRIPLSCGTTRPGKSYVAAVERAISACGHVIVDMADFPAADQVPAELCVDRVRGCRGVCGGAGHPVRLPGAGQAGGLLHRAGVRHRHRGRVAAAGVRAGHGRG